MQDQSDMKTPTPDSDEQPAEAVRAEDETQKSPAEEAKEQEQPVEATAQKDTEQVPAAEARDEAAAEAKKEEAQAEPVAADRPARGTEEKTDAATEESEPAPVETAPTGVAAEEPAKAAPTEAPAAKTAPQEPPRPRLADLQPGMMMDGTVTRIEKYGAFVNLGLADRRDGLIHISELAPHRIRRVEDVVKTGDRVRVRVVSVDRSRGRIALSLNETPEQAVSLDEVNRPHEPGMTSMAMAFERAKNEKRGEERSKGEGNEDRGAKSKREQEEVMRKLAGEQ